MENNYFKEQVQEIIKLKQEIKKIYQASKDGGDPSFFHSKCDYK